MVSITNILTPKTPSIASPTPGRRAFVAPVAFNRAADSTQYAAFDAIAEGGGNRAIEFENCATRNGGTGLVNRVTVAAEDALGTMNLYLFSEEPTNFADNAPIALVDSDRNVLLGHFVLNVSGLTGTTGAVYTNSNASSLFPLSFVCPSDSRSLWGILTTGAAQTPTPTASSRVVVSLHGEQDL